MCCKGFAKIVAYFAIVTSVLAMLCTFYYTVRYWEDGHFRHPQSMSMSGMQGMNMEMMNNCPMMQNMMKKKSMMMNQGDQDKVNNNGDTNETNHEEHH